MYPNSADPSAEAAHGPCVRRLHAVSAGRGQGKPLMLFLHGFPELWFSWWRQMQEFQDEYEVRPGDLATRLHGVRVPGPRLGD